MAQVSTASVSANGNEETIDSLRQALEEARADAAKRTEQLEAAKAKAKALIRLQQERAASTQAKLENDAKLQQKTIDDLTKRITQLVPTPSDNDEALQNSKEKQANMEKIIARQNKSLASQQQTINDLTSRIQQLVPTPSDDSSSASKKKGSSSSSSNNNSAPPGERIANLRKRVIAIATEDGAAVTSIAEECKEIEQAVSTLADDFLAVKTALTFAEQDGRRAAHTADKSDKESRSVRSKLTAAEKEVAELKTRLQKADKKIAAGEKKANNSSNNSSEAGKDVARLKDEKEALDVKLSGMDALLTEKQAELQKVRDKARAYLKEINAEKKALEVRMKAEVQDLKEKLEATENEVKNAEKRAHDQDGEMESCLSLVSEKQKTIQALNMSLSTERKAVENGTRQLAALRDEFGKYKERARTALEERDARLEKSDDAVEAATEKLRVKLDSLEAESRRMKQELAAAKKQKAEAAFNLERAIRAETALELQRTSANSELGIYENNLKKMQGQLQVTQDQFNDVKTREDDMEMRIEKLTRQLQHANDKLDKSAKEHKMQEDEWIQERTQLRGKVTALEIQLLKSNESASAAQRVAAVAARALGNSNSNNNIQGLPESPSFTPQRSPSVSSNMLSPLLKNERSFDDGLAKFSSGSLQKVMASHSVSLGLSSPTTGRAMRSSIPRDANNSNSNLSTSISDDAFRDNQVAVLTSQLCELSTLLDDAQEEAKVREEQSALLKNEVGQLEAQLGAAQKLAQGAPFNYLRSVVVAYLENPNQQLLPVLGDVLAISKEEIDRIRSKTPSGLAPRANSNITAGGRMLSFLGRR